MSSSAASDGAESSPPAPPAPSAPPAPALTIPVICGPTASGKSALASWLSLRRELVIISADSRQIYRGFDIGTAKPTAEELLRVPHRGIDVIEPTERYSAADFADMARAAIREALPTSRIPVVVGGTGFYIAALFRPLWAEPPLPADKRANVQRLLSNYATEELRRWCHELDPPRAHLGRAQLLRAIEVSLLTGARLSDLHVEHARPSDFIPSYLLVDPSAELSTRIASRASAMFDLGWPEEVRRLAESVPEDAPAWKSTGYETVRAYVRGEIDRAAALERVIIETRQYAKRQRTWFRHQLEADRVLRLVTPSPGWQETVDRWITEVEATMRSARSQQVE